MKDNRKIRGSIILKKIKNISSLSNQYNELCQLLRQIAMEAKVN